MSVSLDIDNQPQGSEMSWRTKVGRRLAWERGTMNVGDSVKWLPTGQEGRIFEVRDGGIVAVRGEDWAVYDYADRFELVNECRRGETCYGSTGNGAEG